jgi:hypothetical protein
MFMNFINTDKLICVFNTLLHIFDKYVHFGICGPHNDIGKNTSKT